MRDRAAYGAFVAGLEMPDIGQRRGEERQLLRKLRPGQELVLRHRRADLDCLAEIADDVERGDLGNVDQRGGLDQPKIEHWHERLPAGEDTCVVAIFGERGERLLD